MVNGSLSMVKLMGAAEGGGRRVVRDRCLGGGRRGGEDRAPAPPPSLRLLSIGVVGIVMCVVRGRSVCLLELFLHVQEGRLRDVLERKATIYQGLA